MVSEKGYIFGVILLSLEEYSAFTCLVPLMGGALLVLNSNNLLPFIFFPLFKISHLINFFTYGARKPLFLQQCTRILWETLLVSASICILMYSRHDRAVLFQLPAWLNPQKWPSFQTSLLTKYDCCLTASLEFLGSRASKASHQTKLLPLNSFSDACLDLNSSREDLSPMELLQLFPCHSFCCDSLRFIESSE